MLPENMALSIIDVLNFHQKQGHFKVPKRTFSAISLRIHTPGKYTYKNKTVSFEPASVCIIPEGLSYERTAFEDDILVIHFNILNFVMEDFGKLPFWLSHFVVLVFSIFYIALPYAVFNVIAFAFSKKRTESYLCFFVPIAFILGDFYVTS